MSNRDQPKDSSGRFIVAKGTKLELDRLPEVPSEEEIARKMETSEGRKELQIDLATSVYRTAAVLVAETYRRAKSGEDWENLMNKALAAIGRAGVEMSRLSDDNEPKRVNVLEEMMRDE